MRVIRRVFFFFFVAVMLFRVADDSGRWGRGGLFTALEARSDEPRKKYESAGKMKGEIARDYAGSQATSG